MEKSNFSNEILMNQQFVKYLQIDRVNGECCQHIDASMKSYRRNKKNIYDYEFTCNFLMIVGNIMESHL